MMLLEIASCYCIYYRLLVFNSLSLSELIEVMVWLTSMNESESMWRESMWLRSITLYCPGVFLLFNSIPLHFSTVALNTYTPQIHKYRGQRTKRATDRKVLRGFQVLCNLWGIIVLCVLFCVLVVSAWNKWLCSVWSQAEQKKGEEWREEIKEMNEGKWVVE